MKTLGGLQWPNPPDGGGQGPQHTGEAVPRTSPPRQRRVGSEWVSVSRTAAHTHNSSNSSSKSAWGRYEQGRTRENIMCDAAWRGENTCQQGNRRQAAEFTVSDRLHWLERGGGGEHGFGELDQHRHSVIVHDSMKPTIPPPAQHFMRRLGGRRCASTSHTCLPDACTCPNVDACMYDTRIMLHAGAVPHMAATRHLRHAQATSAAPRQRQRRRRESAAACLISPADQCALSSHVPGLARLARHTTSSRRVPVAAAPPPFNAPSPCVLVPKGSCSSAALLWWL